MPFAIPPVRRISGFAAVPLVVAMILAGSLVPSTSAQGATLRVAAAAATNTKSTQPTKSYATSSVIAVSKSVARGYVQFDISGVDLSRVTKASLVLTTRRTKGKRKLWVYPALTGSTAGITAATSPRLGSRIGKSATLKRGKKVTITLKNVGVLRAHTVLALKLNASGRATFYKTGSKAPTLRLTTVEPATHNPTVTSASSGPVGVPDGIELTKLSGDMAITKAGTVLQNVDLDGYVTIKADNVTIRNSVLRGGVKATTGKALVMSWSGAKNLVIKDSTLVARHPSAFLDGVSGKDVTVQRLDVSNVVDAVKVIGSNVTVSDSIFHNAYYLSSGVSYQADGSTHNDGVQVEGGGNVTISGNTISGFHNAAIMVTQNAARITGLDIKGNTLSQGGCTINMAEKGKGPMMGVRVTSNRFGVNNTGSRACPMLIHTITPAVISGNSWIDSTAAVKPYRG